MPPIVSPQQVHAQSTLTLSRVLGGLLLTVALGFIALYIVVALWRLPYPFDLEWVEGATVDHVRRILQGDKLYVHPSLEFVPFIYTPGYYYLAGLFSLAWKVGYEPLRLLSFLASLGCFLFIFALVRRETDNRLSAVAAVGLFAATFEASGAYLDLARVDSLGLCFILAALYTARFHPGRGGLLVTVGLIFLGYLTKQTALALLPPLLLCYFLKQPRLGLLFGATAALLFGGGILWLNYLHDGWFSYYTFYLPLSHPYEPDRLISFWSQDIFAVLPVACSLGVFYLLSFTGRSEAPRRFYFLAGLGILAFVWLTRVHDGGWKNDLMPAYAFLAVLFGLAVGRLLAIAHALPSDRAETVKASLFAACLIQLLALAYNPLEQVPTQTDLEAGQGFVRLMQSLAGEVYAPTFGFIPSLAGKKTYAHEAALFDVLRGPESEFSWGLLRQLQTAVNHQRFAAIILANPPTPEADGLDLDDYYVKHPLYYKDKSVFLPVTCLPARPNYLYLPRDLSQPVYSK